MHPVVALGVRHEGLAQLVHLLVFQLLQRDTGLGAIEDFEIKDRKMGHLGHFVAVRNFVSYFSAVVACYHNLGWVKVKTVPMVS